MRLFLSSALVGMAGIAALLALAGCPSPKMPTGPAPEYEAPPAPSWLQKDAGPGDAAECDAGTPSA